MIELLLSICLRAPVPGPVVSPYAPEGRYAGHHGVDFAAPVDSPVRAAAAGSVTFAGSVAGMLTVTVDHGDSRSTVSYLSAVAVRTGSSVEAGTVIGYSGFAHGSAALHFSVRIGDVYMDPMPFLLCRSGGEERLYLLPPPPVSYARFRVKRPDGRDFRPSPHRSFDRRGGRVPPARPRPGPLHPGGLSVAEGRKRSQSGAGEMGDDETRYGWGRVLPP